MAPEEQPCTPAAEVTEVIGETPVCGRVAEVEAALTSVEAMAPHK